MEKLLYIESDSKNRKKEYLISVICAFLLSFGICICFGDLFALHDTGTGSGTPGGGLIRIWNGIAETLGNSDYLQLPVFEGASKGAGLFLVICFLGIAVAAYFLIRSGRCWTLIFLILPPVCCNLFFQLTVSVSGVALLAAALLLTISCMKQKADGFWMRLLWTAAVTVVALAMIQLPGIYHLDEKPQAVQKLNAAVADRIQDWRYGTNPLGSGDLTAEKRDSSDETALEVTMEEPRAMYLRGFVGEQYDGSSWEALPNRTYRSAQDLVYWLQQHDFYATGQLGEAAEVVDASAKKSSSVTVSVKDADRRYAYIPYEIRQGGISGKNRSYGGSFIGSTKFGRLDRYSYQVGQDAASTWTKTAAEMFTAAKEGTQSEQTEAYLTAEGYYNNYIYENDTYLSDRDRELLSEYLGASGDQSKGHIDYKLAITGIRKYLNDSFVYTENPGDPLQKGTALETFLDSGKGYDVQFATAATLMFRYYGIPARYVEGYLITPEDAGNADANGTIAVSTARAHAWTEIYVDGVGFVPIEVSPEYEGVMPEADMNIGISNNTLLRPFETTGGNSQNSGQAVKEAKPQSRYTTGVMRIIAWVIVFLTIVLCLILILPKIWKRAAEAVRRRKLFFQKDPKRAVSAMYDWLQVNGMEITQEVRELGNRAAYSPFPVDEADRQRMLQICKGYKKQKRKNGSAMLKR